MNGVTRQDDIRNEYIRGSIRVASVTEAMRLVKEMFVEGKRERGGPKKRWLDVIENDVKRTGVSNEYAGDRVK